MQKGSGTQHQMCFCRNEVPKLFLQSFSSVSACFTFEDIKKKEGCLGYLQGGVFRNLHFSKVLIVCHS